MGRTGKIGVAIPSGYRTLKQQDKKHNKTLCNLHPSCNPHRIYGKTTTRVLHFAQGNGGETLCKFCNSCAGKQDVL